MTRAQMLLDTLNEYVRALQRGEISGTQITATLGKIVAAIEAEGYAIYVANGSGYGIRRG